MLETWKFLDSWTFGLNCLTSLALNTKLYFPFQHSSTAAIYRKEIGAGDDIKPTKYSYHNGLLAFGGVLEDADFQHAFAKLKCGDQMKDILLLPHLAKKQ